jgi:hypothetical protein
LLLSATIMDNPKLRSLAYELARTLDDLDSLAAYEIFVFKYNEAFLRKVLNRVMALPNAKIKRTRGALFTFLVQQNGGNNFRD